MAGALIGALRVTLGIDTAAFEEGLGIAQKRLNAAGKNLQQMGDRLSGLGQTLSIGITAPLAAFGVSAVNAASDAAELQSAFDQTFGDMAKEMTAWATATGDAMGRSTQSIQQAANTFGIFFNQAAPTRKEAAEMSKTFAVLAQDLSSFYNVAESDALQKLRSGLSGESEPLRDFGVFLTEANVKAKALELGLGSLSGELSEQDKIMARYALILESTKNAQGDVARTSGGTANQIRAAQAAFQELQVTVGTKLLPILTPLIGKLAGLLDAFSGLSDGTQSFIIGAAAIAAAIGPVVFAVGSLISIVGSLAPVFAPVVALIGSAGLGAALAAAATAAAPFIAAAAALAAGWALFGDKIGPVLTALKDKLVDTLGPKLTAIFDTVKSALVELWNGPFGEAIRIVIGVLGEFGTAYTSILGETLIRILAALTDAVGTAFKVIVDAVKIVANLLTGDFSGAWNAVKSLVSNVVTGWLAVLEDLAPGAVKAISALVTGVQEWIGRRLSAIWDAAKEKIQSLGDKFKWLWDVVVGHSYIPDLFDGIRSEAARFLPEFVTPLTAGIDTVAQAFEGLDFNMPPLDPLVPTPGEEPNPDGEPSSSAEDDIRESFRRTFSDGVRAALDGDLKGFFQNWFESIGNRAFENILNSVADEFGKLLSGLFGSSGSGGGGLGSVLGGALSSIFGGTPGFALGGSFTVGGRPGRDANLVAFRATRGEKVTITDGDAEGSATGPGPLQFNFYGPVANPEQVRRSAAQAGAQLLRMSATGKRGI